MSLRNYGWNRGFIFIYFLFYSSLRGQTSSHYTHVSSFQDKGNSANWKTDVRTEIEAIILTLEPWFLIFTLGPRSNSSLSEVRTVNYRSKTKVFHFRSRKRLAFRFRANIIDFPWGISGIFFPGFCIKKYIEFKNSEKPKTRLFPD